MKSPGGMDMDTIGKPQRSAARVAGATLLLGMAIVVFGEFHLASGLVVPGNAADTARNILAHETRFRLYAVCDLLYVANLVALLSALYVILKPVDRTLALTAAFFRLIYAVLWVAIALDLFSALRFLGGASYLQVFEADRLQALARLHIAAGFDAYYAGLPFYAAASTLCACLWLKSGYVPRWLAAFGVAASAWGVACAFAFLVFPHFNQVVSDWCFDTPLGLFEMALGLWLLVKGLKDPGSARA